MCRRGGPLDVCTSQAASLDKCSRARNVTNDTKALRTSNTSTEKIHAPCLLLFLLQVKSYEPRMYSGVQRTVYGTEVVDH